MLKIYNSLSRRKEEFVPINGNKVNMYACGITVSGDAHIGHLFQALIYDVVRKHLKRREYDITYARNYTDIDDKIIANANKLSVDPLLFAEKNIEKIDDEMKYFQIGEPDIWLKATENINNIISFVSALIKKGYAYRTKNGDVYFAVEKFKGYGKLSNRKIEDALNGVRIENDEEKNSPLDFALWKSAKPGEPSWDSPWGKGRPGWHIECSVMNKVAFGDEIDIHGGGRDLIFPHHENEIAQSEALTGKRFVKYWMHNGLIKINGQKMSKSLGNTILLKDLRKTEHPETVKFAMLSNSYRNDINFTNELFREAEQHMYSFYKMIKSVEEKFKDTDTENNEILKEFNECMDDDFNTAKALGNLFKYFKVINQKLNNSDSSALSDVRAIKEAYSILGLFVNDSESFIKFVEKKNEVKIPEKIKNLAEERWQARLNKDWAKSDELRNRLAELGYLVKDSKDGYELLKN